MATYEPVEQPDNALAPRSWPDGLFGCFRDLPSCWFAFWCPALTEGRALATAEVTKGSLPCVIYSLLYVLRALIVTLIVSNAVLTAHPANPVGLVLGLWLPGLAYSVFSAMWRKQLRERFGIQGDLVDDFCSTVFCGCCVRAQETRAVAVLSERELDFCSDEPLRAATDKHMALRDRLELEADDTSDPKDSSRQGTCKDHWESLSSFSQGLLLIEGLLFMLACLLSGSPLNTLLLLLSTLQPTIILYLIWWRSNRLDAQADLVVKYFSVGFFWTPVAALYLEFLVSAIGLFFFALFFSPPENTDDPSDPDVDGTDTEDDEEPAPLSGVQLFVFSVYTAFVVAALVEEVLKYTIVRFCPVPSDAATAGAPNYAARNDRDEHGIRTAAMNPAAHRATLIYFVAGALGFTMLETIGYVFGAGSHAHGMHQFWNEAWVLLIRNLSPVHVICAALQAANIVENQVLGKEMALYEILAVPILVHGSFDFVLFYSSPQSVGIVIVGIILATAIMLGGLAWAIKRWRSVTEHANATTTWAPMPTTDNGAVV